MSSPKIEVFFLFDVGSGEPKESLSPTFTTYVDTSGVAILPQPSIDEVGGGAYKFQPTFADKTKGIIYVIETGASPAYVMRHMRPEDWYTDAIDRLVVVAEGRWKIHNSGPYANQLVMYDRDGGILQACALKDLSSNPTILNFFERIPQSTIPSEVP